LWAYALLSDLYLGSELQDHKVSIVFSIIKASNSFPKCLAMWRFRQPSWQFPMFYVLMDPWYFQTTISGILVDMTRYHTLSLICILLITNKYSLFEGSIQLIHL
jgi:hypothetical protein